MEPVAQFLEKIDEIQSNLANAGLDAALRQDVRVALEHLKRVTIQWQPFEDLHGLMLRVSDHLDHESKERKQFYDRLRSIEIETKATLKLSRVICLLFAAIVVFWSVIGWWILQDEISVFLSRNRDSLLDRLKEHLWLGCGLQPTTSKFRRSRTKLRRNQSSTSNIGSSGLWLRLWIPGSSATTTPPPATQLQLMAARATAGTTVVIVTPAPAYTAPPVVL